MQLISIVLPVIIHQDSIEFFVQKRVEEGDLDGLWEFPGGKVELHESTLDAAIREFREEVGVDLPSEELKLFSQFHYTYKDRELLFNIFYFDASALKRELAQLRIEKIPFESAKDVVERANIPAANKEFLMQFIEFFEFQKS